jgi:hypothetical protein
LFDRVQKEWSFAKPDDVRPEAACLATIAAGVFGFEVFPTLALHSTKGTTFAQQFAMHVHDRSTPSTLVQVVDVLGDQAELESSFPGSGFQRSNGAMCGIGMDSEKLPPSLVVKLVDKVRIPIKGPRGGNLFNTVSLPESVGVPECLEPGFGRNAGTSENDDAFHAQQIRRSLA